jgi:hypothetical protein
MPDNARREFLRLAAVASLAGANPGFLQAAGGTRMQGWMTSQDQKLEEVKLRESRTFSGDNANGVVIDATKRYQEVLWVRAAFTDASCCVLSQMEPEKRQALLVDLFAPNGLRLLVGRICIGSSDYSR